MPVTPEENLRYGQFINKIALETGLFDFKPEDIMWHYTDGSGLLGILQTSTLYATQVSALNDSKETEYATDLFQEATRNAITEKADDPEAVAFLNAVLGFTKQEPDNPTLGISKFFVSCFSSEPDDINQWSKYAKGPGKYAIGFWARGLNREPNSILYKVIYNREKQQETAKRVVQATLDFYREGLTLERKNNPDLWARDFYLAWDEWVYKLAPLAKDPRWKSESEFRIVHELKASEVPFVKFSQKKTMLSRHLVLNFPYWVRRRAALLPIAKVMIGPGNHPAFTRVSVRLLLEQMGYENVPVEVTTCTLTEP